jgi:16S rRNA processing protein RimM
MAQDALAIVGLVRNAQGIRGEVVIESLTDTPDAVFASGRRVYAGASDDVKAADDQELTVETSKPFKGGLIVKFAEIMDRNAADLLRGQYLFAPFDELEPPAEDEVYVHDLLGMKAVLDNGEEMGDVISYYELPQGLTLEVQTAKGTVLVPYRPEVVDHVDSAEKRVVIKSDLGIFD